MIDPRYQQIMDALPPDYSAQERGFAADALYGEVAADSTIKRIDQIARKVVAETGEDKLFAMYKPHGELPPMFMVAADFTRQPGLSERPPTPLVDSNGYLTDPSIRKSPIPDLENGKLPEVHAIVLHRTDSSTLESTLAAFRTAVGTHFLLSTKMGPSTRPRVCYSRPRMSARSNRAAMSKTHAHQRRTS